MEDKELNKIKQDILECNIVRAGIEIVDGEERKGVCNVCGTEKETIANRRKNTRYFDEESNWYESCLECYKDMIEYYNELWSNVER